MADDKWARANAALAAQNAPPPAEALAPAPAAADVTPEPAEAPDAGAFARQAEMPQSGLIGDLMGVLDKAGTLMVGGEENRRKMLQSIRGAPGEDVGGLRATAANVADAAISMGPAILASRIGARTGAAKEAIRSGEFTGEFVKPTGEKVPLREQVAKGYREVIPFGPSAVQKAVAPVAAPLVGAGADILSKIAESKPAQWARDRVSEVFGSAPGTPELRELYRRDKQLRGAERGSEQAQASDYIVLADMRKKVADTTGLTGPELDDAIGLAAEQGAHPGTPGAELAAKYPALGNLGHYLRYRNIVGREATKGSTEAAILGEAEMREAGEAWKKRIEEAPAATQKRLQESAVKNEFGDPRVVYHGTNAAFESFEPGEAKAEGLLGPGLYFTENRDVASGYAKGFEATRESPSNVRMQYLDIKNPLKLDAPYDPELWKRLSSQLVDSLKNPKPPSKGADVTEVGAWKQLKADPTITSELEERAALLRSGHIPGDVEGEPIKTNEDAYLWLVSDEPLAIRYGQSGTLTAPGGRRLAKRALNDAIQAEGFDGLTHIGGSRVGKTPHRVWIAFNGEQVIKATPKGPLEDLTNLLHASAALTDEVPLSKLTLSHQSRLLTKEGSKFFGVESGFGTGGKRIREVDFTLPDVGARENWRDLPVSEINRLAQEGKLPGHEGTKAAGPVFESNPLDASVATGLFNGRLTERAQHLLRVKRLFGKKLSEFHAEDVGKAIGAAERAGYERFELPERSASAEFLSERGRAAKSGIKMPRTYDPITKELRPLTGLDDYVLPKNVARRLRGTLMWLDPDSYLNKALIPLRMWDAYQGVWSEFTLTPYMFPATSVRNGLQEVGSTISSGTGFGSMRLAHRVIQDLDKPMRAALQHAMANPTLEEAASEFNRHTDPFFGSDEAKTILGGAHDQAEARFRSKEKGGIGPTGNGTWVIWDDHPETGHPVLSEVTLEELRQKAIEQGQLGLQSLRQIRYGLQHEEEQAKESSALRYMRSVFGDPNEELSLATKIRKKPAAFVARYFEELPRLAQFLEGVTKRGLTPAEAARWTNWYHLDMKRPLTQIERSVFRRAMPFYRWSRFNIPASLRIAFLQPWIPMLTLKMYQTLASGTAEKKLTGKNFPIWMRQQGGFFPMRVRNDERGHPIIYWTTPQGTFSTMDLLQWFGSPELAYKQAVSSLSPIVQELNDLISDQDLRTNAPLTGDDVWMGMRMPARLAAILNTWRPLNRLDRWTTDSKARPNLGLAGNLYNQVAPFSIYPTDLTETRQANARQVNAIQREGEDSMRREMKRLKSKGIRSDELRALTKQRMKELGNTIRELQGKPPK